MDKSEILQKVRNLKSIFENGGIPTLAQHEVHPMLSKSDRLNYLYFTLPVCINFQRSSPQMWQAALKTFEDPETNYLFYPEKVVQEPRPKIQNDLLKHKLSLQKNKHTDIWTAISKGLNKHFNNDPRELIRSGEEDVEEILYLIRIKLKDDFPFLRGTKLSNYWLYILSKFTDVDLKSIHRISIIPDTHIIKSSIKLGLVDDRMKPEEIVTAWYELLHDTDIRPVDMHPVLWNWSRNDFKPEV